MLTAADLLRIFMAAGILGMAVLALVYLQRRSMPVSERIAWGLLACVLPLLGPFLVILFQPGQAVRRRRALRSTPPQQPRADG